MNQRGGTKSVRAFSCIVMNVVVDFMEIVSWLDYMSTELYDVFKSFKLISYPNIELHIELDSVVHGILCTVRR